MNIKPLLDFIGQLEAHGNYNAIYGNPGASEDLSQYTLAQIQTKQYRHGKINGSSAIGKYQFLRKTLKYLIDTLDLSADEKFTPALQDRLAEQLLMQRGLYRWDRDELSDDAFMDSLSKEWASLPYRTGRSYYDGDSMGNHALATRDKFRTVIEGMV